MHHFRITVMVITSWTAHTLTLVLFSATVFGGKTWWSATLLTHTHSGEKSEDQNCRQINEIISPIISLISWSEKATITFCTRRIGKFRVHPLPLVSKHSSHPYIDRNSDSILEGREKMFWIGILLLPEEDGWDCVNAETMEWKMCAIQSKMRSNVVGCRLWWRWTLNCLFPKSMHHHKAKQASNQPTIRTTHPSIHTHTHTSKTRFHPSKTQL